MKNILTVMQNILEEINSRLGNIKEWISHLEERIVKIIQQNNKKEF